MLMRIAVGTLIALLLISLISFYAIVSGVVFDKHLLLSIVGVLSIGSYAVARKELTWRKPSFSYHKANVTVLCLIVASTFILVTSWIYDTYWPVNDWDAVTLYDFRGKILSQKGDFADMLTMEPAYYLAYPLYTSILHGAVYVLGYTHPSALYALLLTAFSLIFYLSLKERTNALVSSATLFLLVSTFVIYHHSQIAYTNLPYLIYFVSGIIFLGDTIEKKSWQATILSAFLIGGSTWIRADDPFWVLPCIILFYVGWRYKRWSEFFVFISIIASIKVPWSIYKANQLAGLQASGGIDPHTILVQLTNISLMVDRVKEVLVYVTKLITQGFAYPIMMFMVSLVIGFGQTTKWQRILRIILILAIILVYLGTFGLSLIYSKWNIVGGSVQRMLMFIIPIILYDIGLTIYNEWVILSKGRQ